MQKQRRARAHQQKREEGWVPVDEVLAVRPAEAAGEEHGEERVVFARQGLKRCGQHCALNAHPLSAIGARSSGRLRAFFVVTNGVPPIESVTVSSASASLDRTSSSSAFWRAAAAATASSAALQARSRASSSAVRRAASASAAERSRRSAARCSAGLPSRKPKRSPGEAMAKTREQVGNVLGVLFFYMRVIATNETSVSVLAPASNGASLKPSITSLRVAPCRPRRGLVAVRV